MEKQNRAERRRNRFGGGRATEHGGWPTVQPNPVFTDDAPTEEAATDAAPETKPVKPAKRAKPAKPAPKADVSKS